MPKSKKKSNKKNKKKNAVVKGPKTAETTLHGYTMTGPFTPGSNEIWYCDHKKCEYTQHGFYRKYKIENWRSTKFGKDFTLCDGCVRQFKKEPVVKPQSQSSSSNVNVKVNINGANPGYQPQMQPMQQQYMQPQQPYAQPQVYGVPQGYGVPQAYGAQPVYNNGYAAAQQMAQPQMQAYAQAMQQQQMQQPQMQQQQMQQQQAPQEVYKPPQPTEAPLATTEQKTEEADNIVVNGVVKQGWMMKKGDIVKSWKKRYFVLRQNRTLNYYESDNAVMVKGTCPLDKVRSVKKKSAQSFEIETSKRKWCFACKDSDTRNAWVKKIKFVAAV